MSTERPTCGGEFAVAMDELFALDRNEKAGRVDHPKCMIDGTGKTGALAEGKDVANAVGVVVQLLCNVRSLCLVL